MPSHADRRKAVVCKDTKFKECDRTTKKVFAILKCKLLVPKFDCDWEENEWEHDSYDCGCEDKKICLRFKGFEECDEFTKKIPALLKCKILGPHFKNDKCYEESG